MHNSRPARALVRGLAAPLALGGLFGGLAAGLGPAAAASAAACQVQGSPQPVSPPKGGVLSGVAVISSCDVWAVGATDAQALTEHFDGTAWKVVPGPKNLTAVLGGVGAVSSSNVYAVGSSVQGTDRFPLVLHWDGQAWAQQTISGTVPDGELSGVKVVSATDIWAVGDADVPGTNRRQPLILHFNGSSWTSTRVPQVAGMSSDAVLDAVSATSAHDAWAVGNVFNFFAQGHDLPFILHWNGILWTRVPLLVSPRGAGLRGVTATAPNDAWAVGFTGSATGQPLTLHWNGRSWNPVPSPSPGGPASDSFLASVTATSRFSAFAVGQFDTSDGRDGLLLRWNGFRWRQVPTANPELRTQLTGVDADSASDVWAVGSTESNNTPTIPFAVHGF